MERVQGYHPKMEEASTADPVELREVAWTTAAEARTEQSSGIGLVLMGVVLLGFCIWEGISEGGAAWWWALFGGVFAIVLGTLGLSMRNGAPVEAAETERLLRDGTRIVAHVIDFTVGNGEDVNHRLWLQFEHPTHGTTVVEHECFKWSPPVHGRKSTLSIIVTDDAWSAPHRPTG